MTKHPMIVSMHEKRLASPIGYTSDFAVSALQWLADPSNLSDDVVEAVAIARYVDAGVDNNDPATWVSYPEACKAEYRMSARNMITAFANALIKEIGDG